MIRQFGICFAICLMSLRSLDCNKQLYISESFIEFIYENFDIDYFDHCQFLFDTEEPLFEDEIISHYHDNIRKCKSTFFFNKNLTYQSLYDADRKLNLRFPVLYYVSISSTYSTRISEFLRNVSNVGLANDIWLIAIDISEASLKAEEEISKVIEELLPNLQLDSQVFVIIPTESNCDLFSVYETYKVSINF